MGNCCGRSRRNFPFPSAIAKRCNTNDNDSDDADPSYYLPDHHQPRGEPAGARGNGNIEGLEIKSSSSKTFNNNKSSKRAGSQRSQKSITKNNNKKSKNSSKNSLQNSNQNHAFEDNSSEPNNNFLTAEHAEILSQISSYNGQDLNNNKKRALSNSPLFSKEGIQHIRDREEPEELDEDLHPSDLSNTRTFFLSKALDDSRKLTTNKGSEKGKTSMHKQFSSTERLEK